MIVLQSECQNYIALFLVEREYFKIFQYRLRPLADTTCQVRTPFKRKTLLIKKVESN